jgi:hypothetical protein
MSQNPADYPNYGLSHSIEELQRKQNSILDLPLEEQAQYADAICRNFASDIVFHQQQLNGFGENNFHMWNTTSIGNIAYMSLHAPEPYKQQYKKIFEEYKQWKSQSSVSESCVIF